ncbi:hypothetical protein [Methanobrevibacter boviskoreani]|uniref:hypothetical protein n=1 Tax=Methanobrevibacter boviskoreani TaxID=1348249 RepID=UPI000594AE0A|nr:hypothetical protein [Methanobrevibacter boviskoreani]
MVKINLSTYYISLINKETKQYTNLDKIEFPLVNGQIPNTIKEILNNFFSNKRNKSSYFKDNKILIISRFAVKSNIFYGEFLYGTYGAEHPVKNIHNNEEETKINKDQSVLSPYYFYIEIPPNTTKGLLILENKNNDGIKGLFEGWFGEFVKKCTYTNFLLELQSFMPEKIIETYINQGTLKKIRFVSYKLPTDKLDLLNGFEPDEGYAELKFQINKEKRKHLTKKLQKLIKNECNESEEYLNIMNNDLKTDDIKFEIELRGSKRTFSINNLKNAVPARDITDELEEGKDGHRTFESINNKGKEYANDILRENID